MLYTFGYIVRRILPFVLVNFLIEICEIGVLLLRNDIRVELGWVELVAALVWICTTLFSTLCTLIPFILYLCLLPKKSLGGKIDRHITAVFFFIFVFLNGFEEISSILFWDEFTSKFNFVAVDYLVYTKEVVGNIVQSYPIGFILFGLVLFSVAVTWITRKRLLPQTHITDSRLCRVGAAVCLGVCMFFMQLPDYMSLTERCGDRYLTEFSKDGLYSLTYAFLHNELEYKRFYPVLSDEEADRYYALLKNKDSEPMKNIVSIQKRNIIIVLMESMDSKFFSEFRTDDLKLTPNLEALAKESLYFSHTYATGTRSVRGIEAATLGVPPLPGMAIVRRDSNDNLKTLAFSFDTMGYEKKWIYGGYGYFDNMNAYFSGNGFMVVDRKSFESAEISFSNIWGVCDEDLFSKVLKEADKSFQNGKPFLNVILTTSNHRPYTYPEGKVSLPPKQSGRKGGVMYADYSIGKFMNEAKTKPWYGNTVFVFMADHGAGSAGRKELNVENHHIPLIIHAPSIIATRKIETPVSQIDMIPTLLGILGLPYDGFMGQNALSQDFSPRIFLSNYQKLAYADGANGFENMVIMSPVRHVSFYHNGQWVGETKQTEPSVDARAPDKPLQTALKKAISIYLHADKWKEWMKITEHK